MGLGDLSFFVDHVSDPTGELVGQLFAGPIDQSDFPIGIRDQTKRKLELLRELPILFRGVEAAAQNDRILCLVLRGEVPEPGTFRRSPGCVGLGVKPENDLLSPQVHEAHRLPILIGSLEIGSQFSWCQHRKLLSHQALQNAPDKA
jgi:hypothetical protein